MSPPDTPLNQTAARFGYHLDHLALTTLANLPATDIAAAALCATLIAHVEAATDPDLRYALSRDREAARLTGGRRCVVEPADVLNLHRVGGQIAWASSVNAAATRVVGGASTPSS